MKLRTLLTLLVTAAGAAGCGGGSDSDTDQGPQEARQRIASAVQAAATESSATTRRQAAAVSAAADDVDPAVEAKALFDFAEAQFPQLFPSHRPDMAAENWRYRFYPETGIFLVVSEGRVYVLGGPFGEQVRYVGLAHDLLNPPSSVQVTVSSPALGKAAWNIASPMKFTLVDTAGMAVSGPFTCTSETPVAVEVASDCSTVIGRRLGTHTINVSNGGIVGQASIKVVPQAQPFGSGANARYNLVAMPDGRALSWGPVDAPLGHGAILGNAVGVFLPTPVKAPTGNDPLTGVVAVAAGEKQAFALTEDGEVYSWGAAAALGRQTTSGDSRPGKVVDTTGLQPLKGIVAVSTGGTNVLALGDDGTVYAWGENTSLGGVEPRKVPVVVPGGKAVAIASGFQWNAALLTDGTVATWGRNVDGATGQGSTSSGTLSPALVINAATGNALSGIVSISAGDQHGFALSSSGIAYGWGRNMLGQLGRGDRGNVSRNAVAVSGPGGGANWTGLRMVAAGGNHSLGLDSTGRVYSWGYSASGELGDGLTAPRSDSAASLPGPVLMPNGSGQLGDAVAVGAGYGHSFALLSDGRLMIWGSGFNGILGQGGSSTARSTLPLAVKNEAGDAALNMGPVSYWPNLRRRMLP
jgi:alpha-tubulin suppressor-like RCC1 family protein